MNDFTSRIFKVCDDWTFKILYDQWWVVSGTCLHQRFVSKSTSLEGALDKFEKLAEDKHKELNSS